MHLSISVKAAQLDDSVEFGGEIYFLFQQESSKDFLEELKNPSNYTDL